MAERVAEKMAADAGLDQVVFTSAATSTEEIGSPIDPLAVGVLRAGGYRTGDHWAHQITGDEVRAADLVIGMEPLHLERVRRIVPEATNCALMTDFDPAAWPGSGIEDPWYGPVSGFGRTLSEIERAMPGVLEWVRMRLDGGAEDLGAGDVQ